MREKGRGFAIKVLRAILVACFWLITPILYASDASQKADLVIFSYDRPLQLYSLLESLEVYVTGLGHTSVIYRVSNEQFANAYDEVISRFPQIDYLKQGAKPQEDFKPLTLRAAFDAPNDHIIFAVDDIIVKDFVDLSECIELLELTGAYGFYLWLGAHITECYSLNRLQRVPPSVEIAEGIYAWEFNRGECDWRYPHTVDMALYRKKDIEKDFKEMGYANPNFLEGHWGSRVGRILDQRGLYFECSKTVNLPLNRVQNEYRNRHMNFLTPSEMLEVFNAGMKIDIKPLFRIKNKDPHMVYEPIFIER